MNELLQQSRDEAAIELTKMNWDSFCQSVLMPNKVNKLEVGLQQVTDRAMQIYAEKSNVNGRFVVFEEHDEIFTQLSVCIPTLEQAEVFANAWRQKKLYIFKFIK